MHGSLQLREAMSIKKPEIICISGWGYFSMPVIWSMKCLLCWLLCTESLFQSSELKGDEDCQSSDDNGVNYQRDDARSLGNIWFDVVVDQSLNDIIPGEGGYQAKAAGCQGQHLFDD